MRIPREYRNRDLKEMALANIRRQIGEYLKYDDEHITANVNAASPRVLLSMIHATEDELTVWAKPQTWPKARSRGMKSDVGYYDARGEWYNLYWYH